MISRGIRKETLKKSDEKKSIKEEILICLRSKNQEIKSLKLRNQRRA